MKAPQSRESKAVGLVPELAIDEEVRQEFLPS
jgi:hypothetical protein